MDRDTNQVKTSPHKVYNVFFFVYFFLKFSKIESLNNFTGYLYR